jgi:N-acetylglucosamine-6-phosphate deacetylase
LSPKNFINNFRVLADWQTGRPGCSRVRTREAGRIARRLGEAEPAPGAARRIDLAGRALAPGFLDLHYHGELILGAPEQARARLERAAALLLEGGVTGFLPTTVAWPAGLMTRVTALAEACERSGQGRGSRWPAPEGPWIAAAAAGAQPAAASA